MSTTKNAKARTAKSAKTQTTNGQKPVLVKAFLKTDTKTLREASNLIMAELARRSGKKGEVDTGTSAVSGTYAVTAPGASGGRRPTNLQNLAVGDLVVYRGKGRNEGRLGRVTRLGQVRGDIMFDGDKTETRYVDLTALLRCHVADESPARAKKAVNAR